MSSATAVTSMSKLHSRCEAEESDVGNSDCVMLRECET